MTQSFASGFDDDDDDDSAAVIETGVGGLTLNEDKEDPRVATWKSHARAQYSPSHPALFKAPTEYTGYDSQGKAHRRTRSPSPIAGGNSPPRSNATVAPRSNFAKVKVRIISLLL